MQNRYNFHKDNIWTSAFDVYADIPIDAKLEFAILKELKLLEDKYSMYNSRDKKELNVDIICNNSEYFKNDPEKLAEACNYDPKRDYFDPTCLMKGLAIKIIHDILFRCGSKSHLINFGGDILGYNTSAHIRIDNTNFNIDKIGTFCVFTSGNTDKRGHHIEGKDLLPYGSTLTLVFNNIDDPAYYDALCTRMYAGDEVDSNIVDGLIIINKDGKLMNNTYCASPFFNNKEISIRDRMIQNFDEVFRPDLTNNSKSYDKGPSKELAELIYEDNVNEISNAYQLVFPQGTNDLGTLFELGHALKLNIPIIRYDDNKGDYTFIDMEYMINELNKLDVEDNTIIDCSKVQGAVVIGYFNNDNIKYYLGDLNDNIMLSIKHDRVNKLSDGSFKVMPKKFVEGM